MAPSVNPSTVWAQNWSFRQLTQKSMVVGSSSRRRAPAAPSVTIESARSPCRLEQGRRRPQQLDLAVLDLEEEHVGALDVAVVLEADRLGDALELRDALDVVEQLRPSGVPRLDPRDEDAGHVVAFRLVRAGVGSAVGL